MKAFRTKYPFVITKGNTLRKQAECETIMYALRAGKALCARSKSPYFQIWYKNDDKWLCDFFNARSILNNEEF